MHFILLLKRHLSNGIVVGAETNSYFAVLQNVGEY